MQNVSHNTLIAYFESLGLCSTDVATSFRWNTIEYQNSLRSGVTPTVMLIDSPHVQEEGSSINLMDVHNCALTFLGKPNVPTARIDAYDNQNEVLEHCQQIAFEFRNKLRLDASAPRDAEGNKNWLFGALVINSFNFLKVGPVFTENMYGYRLEFQLKIKPCACIDTEKWCVE